ncbi:MAG TPA: hypothetical protein PKV41_02600 [Candidatus Omnitrophota bacterium]|nr:hypothetical protein [Candidatus Omnitrophota bacterium]
MNKFLSSLLVLVLAAGCGQPPQLPRISASEAHKKLVSILKIESNLDVTTKEFDQSLWIYVPFTESFLEMKAKQDPGPGPSDTPTQASAIYFLDARPVRDGFEIRYDIGPSKNYAKDPGYASTYSEKFQAAQRNILMAISRAYADFEEVPGQDQLRQQVPGDVDFAGASKNASHKQMVHDYIKTEKAPLFFVIVLADIVNGLETRILLHLKDLKRGSTDQTFYEEYTKRVISEELTGNPAIIGDTSGRHVDFHNITMPEFLAKQIISRIRFKYTQSAFPPSGTPKDEILKAVVETVDAYGFEGFASVVLKDLSSGTIDTLTKEQLASYRENPSEGRLIRIRFQ